MEASGSIPNPDSTPPLPSQNMIAASPTMSGRIGAISGPPPVPGSPSRSASTVGLMSGTEPSRFDSSSISVRASLSDSPCTSVASTAMCCASGPGRRRLPASIPAPAAILPMRSSSRCAIVVARSVCVSARAFLTPSVPATKSRHHQKQRIARPLLVAQQAVEFRIGAKLGRGQVRSLARQQRREDLPARRDIVDGRKLDRLRRVEQRDGRARPIILAMREYRREPADRPLRLALQEQHPKRGPATFDRCIAKLADPIPELVYAARRIVDDDQRGLVPGPFRNVLLSTKSIEFPLLLKPCKPTVLL